MQPLSLHALHTQLGATFRILDGQEVVHAYRAPADERRACREGAALFDLSFRPWTRLRGHDHLSFLHGMVTNDIEGLGEGQTAYAAMLTPKGGMIADLRLVRRLTEVVLDTEPARGETVRTFLEKHVISEDVTLEDATQEWAMLSLVGPKAGEAVGASKALTGKDSESVTLDGVPLLLLPPLLPGPPGLDVLMPRGALGQVVARLLDRRAVPAGLDTRELLRVEWGVPRYGVDMDETTLPLEAGLEQRAISYSKGCYIGQEVIARTTFRGHVNWKLAGFVLPDEAPLAGTELTLQGKAGWVTSRVPEPESGRVLALGYVHRDAHAPGTMLAVATGGQARVHALPFAAH